MLSASTRAQLLDDALNLARAGVLGYDVALDMTRYLAARESHYVPWKALFDNMRFLNTMLRQTPAYGLFQVLQVQPISIQSTGFLWSATLQARNQQVLCSNLGWYTF
jgi:aminopeptidase N